MEEATMFKIFVFQVVTGMKIFQTKIGRLFSNNIANVITTSFKRGRVRFEDID